MELCFIIPKFSHITHNLVKKYFPGIIFFHRGNQMKFKKNLSSRENNSVFHPAKIF